MKARGHQKPRSASQRTAFINDLRALGQIAEEAIPMSDRIDLTIEAVVGARWLLSLACGALDGCAALEEERERAVQSLNRLDQLRNSLKRQRAKSFAPHET